MELARRSFERKTLAAGDFLNPVLVKEVRQALRGRLFVLGFVIALSMACLTTFAWFLDMTTRQGAVTAWGLVTRLLVCFEIAVCVQVPLTAFHSVTSEWDRDGFEMLSRRAGSGERRSKYPGGSPGSMLKKSPPPKG